MFKQIRDVSLVACVCDVDWGVVDFALLRVQGSPIYIYIYTPSNSTTNARTAPFNLYLIYNKHQWHSPLADCALARRAINARRLATCNVRRAIFLGGQRGALMWWRCGPQSTFFLDRDCGPLTWCLFGPQREPR